MIEDLAEIPTPKAHGPTTSAPPSPTSSRSAAVKTEIHQDPDTPTTAQQPTVTNLSDVAAALE